MIKISQLINSLLVDLSNLKSDNLSEIVRFVILHKSFKQLLLINNNVKSSKEILSNIYNSFLINEFKSDIQLAGLIVLIAKLDASILKEIEIKTDLSRAMLTSFLIEKEVR